MTRSGIPNVFQHNLEARSYPRNRTHPPSYKAAKTSIPIAPIAAPAATGICVAAAPDPLEVVALLAAALALLLTELTNPLTVDEIPAALVLAPLVIEAIACVKLDLTPPVAVAASLEREATAADAEA